MTIGRSNITKQISRPPRNRVALKVRSDPRYKQRVVKDKTKYSRKTKHKKVSKSTL